jgi:dUTP pyrophosphatase
MITINYKIDDGAFAPFYATDGAAGFDIAANETIHILRGETKLVKTGLYLEIPGGYELQIRPRSGVSLRTSLSIANSPATIDSDYRGEICIIVENKSMSAGLDSSILFINKGDRIAQGILSKVPRAIFNKVDSLSETNRGEGGFGSTGK